MEHSRRKTIRVRRLKKKKRRVILYLVLILLLFAAAALWAAWNIFTVQNVQVEGNKYYTKKQIQEFVMSDSRAWNSLYVLLKYKFFKTENVPFVDTMEISLKDPHTVKIRVSEKAMIGSLYIPAIGQNAYFDTDGFVVETSKKLVEGVLRVEGLDCDKVVLYEKLPIKDEDTLKNLLTATRSLEKNEAVPERLIFGEDGSISLDYGTIRVLLGTPEDLTTKIRRLPYILPKILGKTGTLHAENWTENTKNIIFNEEK